jgi:hypothetical protein
MDSRCRSGGPCFTLTPLSSYLFMSSTDEEEPEENRKKEMLIKIDYTE